VRNLLSANTWLFLFSLFNWTKVGSQTKSRRRKEKYMKQSLTDRILFPAVIIIAAAASAFAQAGSLDTSFGSNGKTLVNFSFISPAPEGVTVQADGKIVSISGGFNNGHKLVRLNADGSLDTSFGGDGSVEFLWSLVSGSTTYYGKAYAVGLQNIGGQERIVVAGAGHLKSGQKVLDGVLRVQRFMPDGSVDTSFGTNGSIVQNTYYASAMAIQTDGKIVVVGGDVSNPGKLVRLNVNGSLDTSFGTGGIAVGPVLTRTITVDAAGGIIVGGGYTIGKGNSQRNVMAVQRFLSNGVLDTTFGTAGRATADFGGSSEAYEVKIDLAGNIVAGAKANGLFAVARFTSSGQPDLSFNGTGRATGPGGDARGMVLQSDGKPVVTGPVGAWTVEDFQLVRFNTNGSLDNSFGTGGVLTADIYQNDFSIRSAIQIDPACGCEKIIMTGGTNPYITFARFATF
jgi:uncharacterized delta-60 repeat protein